MELQVRIYQISFSRGFEKTMPQIEKPDDLQLIANLIRFFSYALQFSFYDGNKPKSLFLFPCIQTAPNRPLYVTEDCHLRANLKKRHFARKPS